MIVGRVLETRRHEKTSAATSCTLRCCVPGTDPAAIARVKAGQTPEEMRVVYRALKDHPQIRWKDSYKRVLGLDLPAKPGLDL